MGSRWPRSDACQAFLEEHPDDDLAYAFGPAHVVLDDGGTDDDTIRAAIERIDHYRAEDYSMPQSPEALAATRAFLVRLLEMPEDDENMEVTNG